MESADVDAVTGGFSHVREVADTLFSMVLTRQQAEAKLSALRARPHKQARDGSRLVFYVASTKRYVVIDGIGGGQIRWSEALACPACK